MNINRFSDFFFNSADELILLFNYIMRFFLFICWSFQQTSGGGENRARQLRNVSYPSCYAIVQEFIVHRSETFRKCHLVMVSWSNKKEKKKIFPCHDVSERERAAGAAAGGQVIWWLSKCAVRSDYCSRRRGLIKNFLLLRHTLVRPRSTQTKNFFLFFL